MPASIFSGTKVKLLKDHLIGFSDKDLIISGTANPTTSATDATPGTLYLNSSTGQVFRKQDSGSSTNWTDISDAIGDDYIISKENFENNIGNASTASTGCTVALNSSTPLAGSQSLRCSTDTTDRTGAIFVLDAFTVKKGLFATVINFETLVSTSADYLDEDWSIVLYDVTNSVKIPMLPEGLLAGDGIYRGAAQTSADGLSYEIRAYVDSDDTNARDVDFDNIKTYIRGQTSGTVVTEWEDWTPTGAWTTNVTYTGQKRRVGDTLEARVKVACSGAVNAVSLLVNLPSGLSADSSKIDLDVINRPIGQVVVNDSDATWYIGYVSTSSTTQVRPFVFVDNSTYENATSITNTAPFTFGSGDEVALEFSVPIVGWGAQAILGEDAGQRAVVFSAYKTAGSQTITAGAGSTLVTLASEDLDNTGSFSSSLFTAPESGYYSFQYTAFVASGATPGSIELYLLKNATGTQYAESYQESTGTAANEDFTKAGGAVISLAKGDTVGLYAAAGAQDVTITGISAKRVTSLSGHKIQSPQQIAAGEKVFAKYTRTTSQNWVTNDPVDFDTKVYDSHNAVTTGSSWVFTCPVSGEYRLSYKLTTTGVTAAAAGEFIASNLYRATSLEERGYLSYFFDASTSLNATSFLTTQITLDKGETIHVRFQENVTAAVTMLAAAGYNTFEIEKID